MDIKKLVVYFALAAVSLTLWRTWQTEHPPVVVAPAAATAPIDPATPSAATTNAATTNAAGIPLNAHPLPSATTQELSVTASPNNCITIDTDLLHIRVNRLGGTFESVRLKNYPEKSDDPLPYELLENNADRTYLAQSGIVGLNNNQPLLFNTDKKVYTLDNADHDLTVNLVWTNNRGVTVTKQIVVEKNSYVIKENYSIKNASADPLTLQVYNQLSRSAPQQQSGLLHAMTTFVGGAYSTPQKPYQKLTFKELGNQGLNQTVHGGWVAFLQQYFLAAWIPAADSNAQFYSFKNPNDLYSIGYLSTPQTLNHNAEYTSASKLYVGPEVVSLLEKAAPHLNLTIDYGWLWFISIIILWLLQHIHALIGNWGWAIVIVTILIKLAFYHLSATSYRSMAKMRVLQPKIQALKAKCGDDKQKFSQAMMELYRKEKANPFSGCLPILVQIPVFIALYWVLLESVELRQSPFIFWIKDLAAPDPYFILPIIMGISMLIQQKISPAPPDPMQAKMMMILPVVFTFFFLNFPSGLVLYWVVNNTLSIMQQWYIMKKLDRETTR